MSCCCPHAKSTGKLFSLFAGLYRRRFIKKGFEPPQKKLYQGLKDIGFTDATLLEIGCGVGFFHQTMLEHGAQSALGIDLAAKMLTEAEQASREHGLSERTEYIEGDFINLADQIEPADITLLDKVVCCYPDANTLVHQSLSKTKRLYALIYPRDRWYTRLGVKLATFMLWLIRSDFRPYVHDPKQVETWITAKGFQKQFEAQTLIWLIQIYQQQ